MKTNSMIHRLLFTACITALLAGRLYASDCKFSGTVCNIDGEPLPFATVALYNSADSSFIAAGMTDEQGSYAFTKNINPASYVLEFSYVGLSPLRHPVAVAENNNAVTYSAKLDGKEIDEVNVVAQRRMIVHHADRIEVNVANSSLNNGNSAIDILQKSPGVIVKDGNIQLMGKDDVMIMINNRPTHMSKSEVVAMLESMQSSDLETIDIITSPSAKYEAEGAGGIININTKKKENEGFKATLTAGAGYGNYAKHKEGVAVYMSQDKVAWYAGANYSANKKDKETQYRNSSPLNTTTTEYNKLSAGDNLLYRAGSDIYLNNLNTIGIAFDGNISADDITGDSYSQMQAGEALDSVLTQDIASEKNAINWHLNADYEHKLKKAGSTISCMADYFTSTSDETISYDGMATANTVPYRTWLLENPSEVKVNVLAAGTDYVLPLKDTSILEMGIKTSTVLIDYNRRSQYNQGATMSESQTEFDYTEQIHGAYLSWKKNIRQIWKVKAGLRAEYTATTAQNETGTTIIDSSYMKVFPSLFVMRPVSQKHIVKFAYTERLTRPEYDALNPFNYYLDPNSIYAGNPKLMPMVTRKIEIGHIYDNWLTTNIFMSYNTDEYNQIAKSSNRATMYITENLGTSKMVGLFSGGYKQIKPWWGVYANVTVGYLSNQYTINEQKQNDETAGYDTYISNQFYLPKKTKFEFVGTYSSAGVSGIYHYDPVYTCDATLTKTFGKRDNIVASLTVSDIFNTKQIYANGKSGGMNLDVDQKEESRQVWLSLTWNIGNDKVKNTRDKKNLIEDQQGRLQKQRGK